jgi:hypothetical protein
MAKAMKQQERREASKNKKTKAEREKGTSKGKGKGKGPSRNDPHFEHAGVPIAIRKKWMNNIVEVTEVNDRIMILKLASATGGITFISVYAPPVDHETQEKIR